MARTAHQIVEAQLGALIIQVATLQAQVEEQAEQIAKLEPHQTGGTAAVTPLAQKPTPRP